jgi:predicted aldo/keto reductase-like oxidoreductase
MKRRPFLKIAGLTAGQCAVGLKSSFGSESSEAYPTRILGRTGEKVSIVGLPGLSLMHDEQEKCNRTMKKAQEQGINFFDNAPAYGKDGDCEKKMGIGMKGIDRDKVFLACKTKMRDKEGARMELERSLKRLNTDHFDLYQMHYLRKDEEVEQAFGPNGVMETMFKAQKEGKIRFIGFSSHTTKSALKALQQFNFDTVMFPINFIENHIFGFGSEVTQLAKEKGTAVLAMKTMCGGLWPEGVERTRKWWYRPLEDQETINMAVRYSLSQPSVAVAIPPGFIDLFKKAVIAGRAYKPITEEESKQLTTIASSSLSVFKRQQIAHAGPLPSCEADDYYKYCPCAHA